MRFDFISDFSELCDEYRMGSGGTWKDNERIISKDDCKQILVALKYLLNGEYSDKIEEVLDNKWIAIFGQHYPKYSTPENNEYIIEKIERGQYSIHKGDMYEDNLRKLENQSREHLFRRIALAMELALSEDYHSYSTELVVVYSISY